MASTQFGLTRNSFGKLVLTTPDGEVHVGVAPVRAPVEFVGGAVAERGGAAVARGVLVVAVGAAGRIPRGREARDRRRRRDAVVVAVLVAVPDAHAERGALVADAVAVVVAMVADLDAARVIERRVVAAVAPVRDEAGRRLARHVDQERVAVAVLVAVGVPRARVERRAFVHRAVAVVVDAVALLGRRRLVAGIVCGSVGVTADAG